MQISTSIKECNLQITKHLYSYMILLTAPIKRTRQVNSLGVKVINAPLDIRSLIVKRFDSEQVFVLKNYQKNLKSVDHVSLNYKDILAKNYNTYYIKIHLYIRTQGTSKLRN
jgi:hypothetical protein